MFLLNLNYNRALLVCTQPPELLAAILDNVNSLMDELWTENPYEGYKEDLGSWRNGIQNIDGLYVLIIYVLWASYNSFTARICVPNTSQKHVFNLP